MRINIVSETLSDSTRVFKLGPEDQKFIDKEFDALHKTEKMK
jgi:hypothetical protein